MKALNFEHVSSPVLCEPATKMETKMYILDFRFYPDIRVRRRWILGPGSSVACSDLLVYSSFASGYHLLTVNVVSSVDLAMCDGVPVIRKRIQKSVFLSGCETNTPNGGEATVSDLTLSCLPCLPSRLVFPIATWAKGWGPDLLC